MAKRKNTKGLKDPWKKGQSGNPNGRPKKLVSSILAELKEEGELVTRSLVEQTYQVLMSLTQEQLTKIASDKKQPMINRIVSKEMLSKKGFEIIEKMMDRANGKAVQMSEITQNIDVLTIEEDLTKLSTHELKRRIEASKRITESREGDSEA